MISLKKSSLGSKGFTIIELLIVITVIIILTLLVASTYSSIKARARNSTRETNLQEIQRQLESFFSQNGYYPSLADMNNSGWLSTNMKNLDQKLLIDPSNSTQSKSLVADPTAKSYSYHVIDSSGNSCASDDTTCAKYKLTATYEGTVNGQSTYSKTSLE